MKRVRILSIDGGGVGGIIPAEILRRLVSFLPDLVRAADVVAGTSTGALLALALAAGKRPDRLVRLYEDDSPTIFGRSFWRNLTGLWGVARARYSAAALRSVVEREFGELELRDLDKPVLIPSVCKRRYDGRPAGAKFWSTLDPADADGRALAVDVALASSAAPTYFPAHVIDGPRPSPGIYWDGGLSGANNPAAAAIAAVRRRWPDAECVVLSLGTGDVRREHCAGDWGAAQSAMPVIATLMDAPVQATAYLVGDALHGRQFRIDPAVEHYEMDDPAAVPRLRAAAAEVDLQPVVTWLSHWWTPSAAAAAA